MTQAACDIEFAQDPLDADALVRTLIPLVQKNPHLHWAVLMDTAFDAGRGPLPAFDQVLNCYAHAGELADLASVAPCLMPMRATAGGQEVLASLVRHAGARPMLSVVASRIELITLVRYWSPLHLVQNTDGQRFALRWADTRVLPLLPRVLAQSQWHAITSPLAHWVMPDREGIPVLCELAPSGSSDSSESTAGLVLSDQQVHRLVEAAEADALHDEIVVQLLRLGGRRRRRSAIHRETCEAFELARSEGVETMADRMALALGACLADGAFLRSALLHGLLQSKEWEPGHLFDELLERRLLAIESRHPDAGESP